MMGVVFGRFGWLVILIAGCEAGSVCGAPGEQCLAAREATRTHWGFVPDALQRADVDGDGVADLAGASHVRGTVSVVWGAGATPGEAATTWSVAPEVAGLAVVDVDLDGAMDLVTAAPESDELVVLRGVGGREVEERRISVGDEPRTVTAVQLVEGGAPELVTVNGDGTVSVVRGEDVSTTTVGPAPRAVAAGDLDGDGDVDLAVTVAGDATLQVLLGDGAGGLVPGEVFAVGAAPESVVAADLDGDGAVDLATADVLDSSLSVLFGDGEGGVKARTNWPTMAQPQGLIVVPGTTPRLALVSRVSEAVQTIDPNTGEALRGAAEVPANVLVSDATGQMMYAGGNQIGTLAPATGMQGTELWMGEREEEIGRVFPVDLDGDGVDELLVAGVPLPWSGDALEIPTASLDVWRDGVKAGMLLTGLSFTVASSAVADLDGDGASELVLVGISGEIVVAREVEGVWQVGPPFSPGGQVASLVAADVDGDGRSELIAGMNKQVAVLGLGDDDALQVLSVRATSDELSGEYVWWVKPVDADGDEELDVLWFTHEYGVVLREDVLQVDRTPRALELGVDTVFALELFDGDGDGALDGVMCADLGLTFVSDVLGASPGAPMRLGTRGCQELAIAEIDETPVVLALEKPGERAVVTPWQRREGVWTRGASAVVEEASEVHFARLGGDIVGVVTAAEREIRGWAATSGAGLLDTPLRSFGGVGPVFADFDGDGAPDAFGYGHGLGVAFGDGDGGFSPVLHRSLPAGSQRVNSAAIADYDEDGRDEVVLSVQPLDAWRSDLLHVAVADDGSLVLTEVARMDRWGVRLAVGDLDEDGRRDLVAHEREMGLMLLRNLGDGGFAEPIWLAKTGATADSGRVMDIDDDGHVDFVGASRSGVFVLRGLGGGEMAAMTVWWRGFMNEWAFAEVTGDGRKDMLMIQQQWEDLVLVPGAGAKAGAPRWLMKDVDAVTAADLDGDGRLEVLAVTEGRVAGEVALHVGRWGADGPSFVRHEVAAANVGTVVVRDFDRDGAPDAALVGGGDVTIVRLDL